MAVGTLVCVLSYGLKLGNWHSPGPGFLPFFAGLILVLLSGIVFLQGTINKIPQKPPGKEAKRFFLFRNWKVVSTSGALFAYAYFIDFVGFLLGTFLLFTFLLWGVERLKGWKALSFSSLFTAAIYFIFQIWLKVQMPSGLLH